MKTKHYWSEEEISFLKNNFMELNNKELGIAIGRSHSSVMNMIAKLELVRHELYEGDLEGERWKKYSTNYLISSKGRIYSKIYKCLLKYDVNNMGYPMFNAYEDSIPKKVLLHRAVAILFKPNSNLELEVNHEDGNKLNPDVDNLEWVTHKINMEHAVETGLHSNFKYGEANPLNKYPDKLVHNIYQYIKEGFKDRFIADTFNVTRDYVSRIRSKKRSKHISDLYFNAPARVL